MNGCRPGLALDADARHPRQELRAVPVQHGAAQLSSKTLDRVLVLRSTSQVWAWPGESRVAQDIVWASAVFTLARSSEPSTGRPSIET